MNHRLFGMILALIGTSLEACDTGSPSAPTRTVAPDPARGASAEQSQRINITVDAAGYHPSMIHAAPGRSVALVFTRTSDEGCGQQVVFPSLNLRRDLPLNQPVEVTVTPTEGMLAFTCGMNMLRGSIVAQ